MFNVNLFIFYGVTGTELQSRVVGIDLSVALAMLYVIAWLVLAAYVWVAAQPRKEGERSTEGTDYQQRVLIRKSSGVLTGGQRPVVESAALKLPRRLRRS